MKRGLKLTTFASLAALAIGVAPLPGNSVIGSWLGDTAALAASNSGGHGNSGGDHGNSGNSKASDQASTKDKSGSGSVTSTSHRHNATGATVKNVVALAGVGNAAHASVQGLLHAAPNSAVGRLKTYADLNYAVESGTLQTAVKDAQKAFDEKYPDFATLSADEKAAALASTEGVALTDAKAALGDAVKKADDAFALVTRNPNNPAVKTYVDGLLSKYYTYLASL